MPDVDREAELRLLEVMQSGVPADVIYDALETAEQRSPGSWEAVSGAANRLRAAAERKRHAQDHAYWLASVRRTLTRGQAITRVDAVEPDEFFARFYDVNRPVHVAATPGFVASQWSFDALGASFGEVEIEIMRDREYGKADYLEPAKHRHRLPLRDYLAMVQGSETNAFYMTSHNGALSGPLRETIASFAPFPGIVHHPIGDASLWIGPKGVKTPLHYDKTNVLMVGLIGAKRVYLAHPDNEPFLAHDPDRFTGGVDVFETKGDVPNLFRYAQVSSVDVSPGQAVLIPVGWWHAVESLTATCSISISSFRSSENFFPSNVF